MLKPGVTATKLVFAICKHLHQTIATSKENQEYSESNFTSNFIPRNKGEQITELQVSC